MNREQAAAALRALTDAIPDVTVTLDLIPDTVMMEEVGQVEAALRLAYTALKDAAWGSTDQMGDCHCVSCHAWLRVNQEQNPDQHDDDCTLMAALAAIRALLPDVGGKDG